MTTFLMMILPLIKKICFPTTVPDTECLFDTGVAGLFYRTDYMEEIGVTDEDMQDLTWDEYLALWGETERERSYASDLQSERYRRIPDHASVYWKMVHRQ